MESANAVRTDRVRFPVTLMLIAAAVLALYFTLWQFFEVFVLAPRVTLSTLHLLHAVRGIAASLLLAGFVGFYLLHDPRMLDTAFGTRVEPRARELDHLRWLIQARWVAIAVTLALIIIAVPLTAIIVRARLPVLLVWWSVLGVSNVLFSILADRDRNYERQIELQISIDLIILTGLLNASGGLENPLSIAYLFHVILAGILLPQRKAWLAAAIGSSLFSFLAVGEFMEWLPHSTIRLFPHGMIGEHAAHDPLFVAGRMLSMVGAMFLTAHFSTLSTEKLRRNEVALERAATEAMLGRQQLEEVIEAAGLGMMIVQRDLRVQWANERFAQWIGRGTHEHDSDRPCFACLAKETIDTEETRESDFSVAGERGAIRYFHQTTAPVRDHGGEIVQVVHVVEEITARKALEAEVMHASRLAVLGQLAAGVAHEIGNPLSSLQARLQLMRRSTDPEFMRESLDTLQTHMNRISRIVRGVSNLATTRVDGWASLDLNSVIHEALSLVRLDHRASNVEFVEDLDPRLPRVRAIRDQMVQVFLNLLLNAVEAMPDGGALEAHSFSEDGRVKVNIKDSGAGMDAAARTHLFEPFFTTKSGGTGLGLSISYSLVQGHGGVIEVCSEPGSGCCFTVDLPMERAR